MEAFKGVLYFKGTIMKRLLVLLTAMLASSVNANNSLSALVDAAKERTNYSIVYDGSYIKIDYPNGDVPSNIGVCTDVIIRSYRKLGVDLQVLVHEDMRNNFSAYPSNRIWGLSTPDRNIDHRRVPNLQTYFRRNGQSLPISDEGYKL